MAADSKKGVQYWVNLVASYEKEFQTWEKRVGKIVDRYTDKKSHQRKQANFNILWSNVQTMLPAVFSRLPKPDVSRRFRDNDPVGRVAALLLERALSFEIEQYNDYRSAMKSSVLDRFLAARGVAWVRYEPHFAPMPEGVEITEDIDPPQILDYECTPVDYVHWRDFGHAVARTWEEVTAIWRRVYMGRQALIARFGEKLGNEIPLDTRPEELRSKAMSNDDGSTAYQACIYEIWDKETKRVTFLSKSMNRILEQIEDPLELQDFWPCAKPLFGTLSNDSLVPVPDFALYQDQAAQLDTLAERISGLIDALRIRGVYDASVESLRRLLSEGTDNDLIPVSNWTQFAEKQGLRGSFDLVDIKPIAETLLACYDSIERVKNIIYEITGLPDIIRGTNDPSATATAEKTKGQFGSLRLRDRQKEVAEFAAELLRIKAQIICKQYQPESIMQLGGAKQLTQVDQQYVDGAIQLLKNEPLRSFRIDIEVDSLVQLDEETEKAQRVEFITGVGSFVEKIAQAPAALQPLGGELLKFVVQAYKAGKTVEGEIDNAIDMLKQQAAQHAANPPPDPEMMKVQAQAQLQQQEMAMRDAADQKQAEREMQQEQFKQRMQAAEVQHQNELEAQRAELEAQRQGQLEALKSNNEAHIAALTDQFNRWKTDQDNATKVIVARIAASKGGPDAGGTGESVDQIMSSTPQAMKSQDAANKLQVMDAVRASIEALTAELSKANQPRQLLKHDKGYTLQ